MLTSEVELALFDCIEMGRGLGEEFWCELHGLFDTDFKLRLTLSQPCANYTSGILCTLILFPFSTWAHRRYHSYLDGIDTYIFVPEGTAQSLTVHRATGDVLINRVSCPLFYFLSYIDAISSSNPCHPFICDQV